MVESNASARSVALGVVERVLHGGYLAPSLSAALDASNLQGHDRSFVTDLTYGVMRRLIQVDHALEPFLKAPNKLPPQVLGALRLGAYEILFRGTPLYAAVNAWVAQVKRGTPRLAGLVNAVLRRLGPPEDPPPHVSVSLPQWLLHEFRGALGDEQGCEAARGMLEPEPLWLTLFSAEAKTLLQQDGAEVEPLIAGAPFPASFRVRSPMPVAQLAAYRLGLVQPQNPSSLQVALALGAGPGTHVHDLAAGRGIKTAVFAAQGAQVTAFELSSQRTDAAIANLRRLGLKADHQVGDLTTTPVADPTPFVILDAPCSGTGTLRGHPEIKLRLTESDVRELAALQLRLLRSAVELVEPGGALLYAVCALTEAEGPAVVQALLEERHDFDLVPVELPLRTVAPAGKGLTDVGAFIMPMEGLDGFYVARLRRTGTLPHARAAI